MPISNWWDILLINENRLANCVRKFYSEKETDFHAHCRKKEDSAIHAILHEAWFRNTHKEFGPDGWDVMCQLVSDYPR